MKYFSLVFLLVIASSCMKSRREYQDAISDIKKQEQQEDSREQGSDDRAGMGADE